MQFAISADHPSLPGHFPDHPVVPGVVILSEIFALLRDQIGQQQITGIHRLKFLHQIPPGQSLRLDLGVQQGDRLPFKCWLDETLAVDGVVTLAP